jgi:hypothetical protein
MDFHSLAYEDMMFFHPFIREAFFDTGDSDRDNEALVHRYVIPRSGTRDCSMMPRIVAVSLQGLRSRIWLC